MVVTGSTLPPNGSTLPENFPLITTSLVLFHCAQTFSPDGHWLVSSSLDATIRTWDLPTGYMVDIFKCESIATSLSFSPNGDFLATAHVDNVGIFLWANRMQFTTVSLRSISEEDAIRVALPTSTTLEEENDEGKKKKSPICRFRDSQTLSLLTSLSLSLFIFFVCISREPLHHQRGSACIGTNH